MQNSQTIIPRQVKGHLERDEGSVTKVMEPFFYGFMIGYAAMKTAIAAVIISLISLVATFILGIKNYRKSKRLEFLQRRDQLFQKISDLNTKNSEAWLIATRFTIIEREKISLPVAKKYEEVNQAGIASIGSLVKKIKRNAEYWDNKHEEYHSLCSSFTLKSAADIEVLIVKVQHALDKMKQTHEVYLSALHLLEKTHPIIEADQAKLRQLEIQLIEIQNKTLAE